MPILDFTDGRRVAAWRPIHDGVMGGVSSGRVRPGEGSARFEGVVSLDHGGGFASFRMQAELPDLTGCAGLRLRVRGDGQTYKLALRTDDARDGIAWQARIAPPAGAWTTVELGFEGFVPTRRGRHVEDAPPLDTACIRQLGLVIGDGQAGPFALELAWIDVLPQRAGPVDRR